MSQKSTVKGDESALITKKSTFNEEKEIPNSTAAPDNMITIDETAMSTLQRIKGEDNGAVAEVSNPENGAIDIVPENQLADPNIGDIKVNTKTSRKSLTHQNSIYSKKGSQKDYGSDNTLDEGDFKKMTVEEKISK